MREMNYLTGMRNRGSDENKLSLLNEYIEFIKWDLNHPTEERDGAFAYYYGQAQKMAEEIIALKKF